MKLKIEISEGNAEEIIIRAPAATDEVRRLQRLIESELEKQGEIALHDGGREYYVPYGSVLFFETCGGKTYAHTDKALYVCQMNLTELCAILPDTFVRASKSCLINAAAVGSVTRSPTGVGEAGFTASKKTAYISRMYYKAVKEKIKETRLNR